MNRAILIVICDFLVSSMLSMMTGMVPAHTGGTGVGLDDSTTMAMLMELSSQRRELLAARARLRETADKFGSSPEREAELRRLAAKIASTQLQMEKLDELSRLTPKTAGQLSSEELARRLDAEKLRRIKTELELKEASGDLNNVKDSLSDARGQLLESRKEAERLRADVGRMSNALADVTRVNAESGRRLEDVNRDLAEANRDLAVARSEANTRQAELYDLKQTVKELSMKVGDVTTESQRTRNSLVQVSTQLDSSRQDLAEYKDKYAKQSKEKAMLELQNRDLAREKVTLQELVRRALAERDADRSALEAARKDLEEVRIAEAKSSERAKTLESRQKSNVYACYDNSIVELSMNLYGKRVFGKTNFNAKYYLPVVKLNGAAYVLGDRGTMLATSAASGMKKVDAASYFVGVPGEKGSRPDGPLKVLQGSGRLLALECNVPDRVPLETITLDALRDRGVGQLYLFKRNSAGRDSAELGERCSLDRDMLVVRNSLRGTAEIKAEPGDFVMTREGMFVGIVVSTVNGNRIQDANVELVGNGEIKFQSEIPVSADSITNELGKAR
ncbi:MAG: hypothetical protein MJ025_04740 [Victivallaceae bacterium]|nr:hypothetical protein [Victivallaceae bacterium]